MTRRGQRHLLRSLVPVSYESLAHVCFMLLVVLPGCAAIEPWEHQHHADPIMQLVDDGEELAYEQHMFRALVQGLSGAPVGGGGCGCEQ